MEKAWVSWIWQSEHVKELQNDNLIAFKYCDEKGNVDSSNNPNGSIKNIAGILNADKNILGLMPHPERMTDKMITSDDGVNLFLSVLN